MKQKKTERSRIPLSRRILGGLAGIVLGISAIMPSSCNLYQMLSQDKDRDYSVIVVFAYDKNKYSDSESAEIFSELKDGGSVKMNICGNEESINYDGIESWFEKQSEHYGKDIRFHLIEYPEQINISEKVNDASDFPVDIMAFRDYMRCKYPSVKNYDFTAVIYKSDDPKWDEKVKVKGYTKIKADLFFMRDIDTYTLKNGPVFAHELTHDLGATDKAGKEYEGICDDNDIMRDFRTRLDDSAKITDCTAKEIGWLN